MGPNSNNYMYARTPQADVYVIHIICVCIGRSLSYTQRSPDKSPFCLNRGRGKKEKKKKKEKKRLNPPTSRRSGSTTLKSHATNADLFFSTGQRIKIRQSELEFEFELR